MKVKITLFFVLLMLQLVAQDGFIRGEIFDGNTGETIPGVTIIVKDGSGKGTISDLDGKFSIQLKPGTYVIAMSFISYQTVTMEGIIVNAGKVTLLDNIALKEETIVIQELVKTAKAVRNTETAMLTIKKKSPNVLDGISSASLKRIGDSDAASSMKRVTGVSVVGGKYVYVRGLGDRYTKTILNGVDLPGLDPDRNSLQMDLFPTNIIDNIVVHKSFNASLPADFTGGVVDIELLDFPETRKANIAISGGVNPNTHFNDNYLTYNGGKTDFLGFDDGTRQKPDFGDRTDPLLPTENDQQYIHDFSPTMGAIRKKSFMDYGLSGTYGNQKQLKSVILGYNIALSYKNTTDFYEGAEFGKYALDTAKSNNTLLLTESTIGDYGTNNVLMSILGGIALKKQRSKYILNLLHIQNGESQAAMFDYKKNDAGTVFNGMEHDLLYSQRSISNILLSGTHTSKNANWRVVWKLSPTLSQVEDPDIRFTMYQDLGNELDIDTESGFPSRIWRDLTEVDVAGKLDLTKEFEFNNRKSKLNFGGAYTYKNRDYIIENFLFNPKESSVESIYFTGNPDEVFYDENIYDFETNVGFTVETPFLPKNTNEYSATTHNVAAYVSTELSLLKKLRTTLGVRLEYYTHYYSGLEESRKVNNKYAGEKLLNDLGIFPTINMIYNATDKMNLRFSYSKTIARPSFKELSYVEIQDPISKTEFMGGLWTETDKESGEVIWNGKLTTTDIHNFDLRWEIFANGFMSSVSGYYKKFINPIEIVQYTIDIGSYQPRNVGNGQVYGVELEFRFELNKLIEKLPNVSINSNFTLTESRIQMGTEEYSARVENARDGQKIEKYRNMAGQSPYLINTGISYNGAKDGFFKSFVAGIYYNVQGRTLEYVGIATIPDIYTEPFHSVNINSSLTFGKEKRTKIGFKISNILGSQKALTYEAFESENPYYKLLNPGTTYSCSLSYNF